MSKHPSTFFLVGILIGVFAGVLCAVFVTLDQPPPRKVAECVARCDEAKMAVDKIAGNSTAGWTCKCSVRP